MGRRIGAAALASLMLMPLAVAEAAPLSVQAITLDGSAGHDGTAALFWLQRFADGGAPLQLELEAERMHAVQYNRTFYYGPTVAGFGTPLPQPVEEEPTSWQGDHVKASLLSQDAAYRLAVHGDALAAPFAMTLESTFLQTRPVGGVSQGPGGMGEDAGASDQRGEAGSTFMSTGLAGPFAFMESDRGSVTATFLGDLVLELKGVDLLAEDGAGDRRLYSTRDPHAVGPAPALVAHRENDAFLRIHLEGARLTAFTPDLDGRAQMAVREATAEVRGSATFHEAHGLVQGPGGARALAGENYVVAGPLRFQVAPETDALAVAELARGEGDMAPSGTVVDPTRSVTRTALLVMAGLAASAGMLVVGFQWALRRSRPRLAAVEEAIAAGAFARAARMARRLLRREPQKEGAAIALGIAYTKSGRPDAAVAAIEDHLDRADPSDGVLHYVLGLAYLDMGRRDRAQVALAEAVRRTPVLAEELAARMDDPPVVALPGSAAVASEGTYDYA